MIHIFYWEKRHLTEVKNCKCLARIWLFKFWFKAIKIVNQTDEKKKTQFTPNFEIN